MKPSEEIFELIHALNQTEKRYFKLYASRSGERENVYIRLFDAIDRQKEYDERALREKFRSEPFVKQLHVAKNYLYKVILKSLAAYHSKTSGNAQALEMLRAVEVLYEKGLYKQCDRLIKKGKSLCKTYEKFILLAQFCEWESKLLSRKSQYKQLHEALKEEKENLGKVDTIMNFKLKAFSLYQTVVQFGVARDKIQLDLLDREMNDPLLKMDDKELSNEARYYKYSANGLHASATGNKKTHLAHTRKVLEIFEKNSVLRNEYPYHYISSINNLCNALFHLGKTDETLTLVKKLREFCGNSGVINKWEDAYFTGLLISYDLEITAYMNSGQFQKIPTLISPIDDLLKKHGKKLKESYLLDLIYDISYGLFILKDYDKSLEWLLKIIHEQQLTLRQDIYSASRILHLLLHYEIGNELLLRNIIKPTSRHLDKRKRLFPPEKILLQFLDEQIRLKNKDGRSDTFKALQRKMEHVLKQPLEQRVLNYFDISAWIESKLLKRDLQNVLREKFLKEKSKQSS